MSAADKHPQPKKKADEQQKADEQECDALNASSEDQFSKPFLDLREEMIAALSGGYMVVVSSDRHIFIPHNKPRNTWVIAPGSKISTQDMWISVLDVGLQVAKKEHAICPSLRAVMYAINSIVSAAYRPGMVTTTIPPKDGDVNQCREVGFPKGATGETADREAQ